MTALTTVVGKCPQFGSADCLRIQKAENSVKLRYELGFTCRTSDDVPYIKLELRSF